ncbi:MAG TPA: ribonuclease HII [Gammaproteobacteria bacterium]|nr:ribonuclease HII [Gammaproteobacteria bacterium]
MTATVLIAGVDEVGRGALAGPVVTAAVVWPPGHPWPQGLADSKALTARARERLALAIRAGALAWSLGRAEPGEVDALNVLVASLLAMSRAVAALAVQPGEVWVDGNHAPDCGLPVRTIIGGDASVPAISAASILAKVARDAEMTVLDQLHPGYGFARHKGYPTPDHKSMLQSRGVSPVHRRAYAPVRQLLLEIP